MKSKFIEKLSSRAGETIAETLISLLISALALMMLAGAVSAGMRVVTSSRDKMDEYYKVNNAVIAREDTATTVDGTEVSVVNGTMTVSISNLLPAGTIPSLTYRKNEQLSGVPVVAYYTELSTS